jgi:hypothetical protein
MRRVDKGFGFALSSSNHPTAAAGAQRPVWKTKGMQLQALLVWS